MRNLLRFLLHTIWQSKETHEKAPCQSKQIRTRTVWISIQDWTTQNIHLTNPNPIERNSSYSSVPLRFLPIQIRSILCVFSTGEPCKDRLILTAIPCRENPNSERFFKISQYSEDDAFATKIQPNDPKWPKMAQNGIVPLAPEILLAPKLRWTCHLRGSHGLSARRAWKTKSSRPEGPKEWPKATS